MPTIATLHLGTHHYQQPAQNRSNFALANEHKAVLTVLSSSNQGVSIEKKSNVKLRTNKNYYNMSKIKLEAPFRAFRGKISKKRTRIVWAELAATGSRCLRLRYPSI